MQRLHRNHGGYQGETIDIVEVLARITLVAQRHRWTIESIPLSSNLSLLACQRLPASVAQSRRSHRVYLSTGMHGDEPAGPLAALWLMEANAWPPDTELWVLPCLNPTGFLLNRRENAAGVDLNRDYRHQLTPEVRAHIGWLERQPAFDVTLCLHEDWESHGFYLYELNPEHRPTLAPAIIAAVAAVCPIDRSEVIEGRPAAGGIIRPSLDPAARPQWPEAFWLLQHRTRLSYTLEAPSDFALETRVCALVAAVNAVLADLGR